jgi:hypothetical protein
MPLAWVPPAGAQAPDEAKIPEVITRQLDAMHRDDAAAAFAIASPAIQSIFQDAPTCMRMVQLGFPQLYRSRNHRFLKLDTSDGRLIERVLIEWLLLHCRPRQHGDAHSQAARSPSQTCPNRAMNTLPISAKIVDIVERRSRCSHHLDELGGEQLRLGHSQYVRPRS